jgi:hypothetical protein
MTIADLSKEQVEDLIAHLEQYLAGWGQLESLEMLLSRTQTSLEVYLDGGETPAEDDPVLLTLQSALQDRQRTLEANAARLQQATTQVDTVLARLLTPGVAPVPDDDGDDARRAVADIVDTVMDGGEGAVATAPEVPGGADPPDEDHEGAPEAPGRDAAAPPGGGEDAVRNAPAAPVEPRPAGQAERADPAPAGAGIWDALIESEANPQTGRG